MTKKWPVLWNISIERPYVSLGIPILTHLQVVTLGFGGGSVGYGHFYLWLVSWSSDILRVIGRKQKGGEGCNEKTQRRIMMR